MKKCIYFLLIILLTFSLSGCGAQNDNDLSSDSSQITNQNTEKPHQSLVATEIPNQINWFTDGLSKAGLKNVKLENSSVGCFTSAPLSFGYHAFLVCDYDRYGKDNVYHDTYLAIETDSKILLKDLSDSNYIGSYFDELYTRDIDGDTIDEIIINQTVGMTGGTGQYLSRIYKVIDNEIKEIFNSSSLNMYDTGFVGTLKDTFKLEIKNKFANYVTTLDFAEKKAYIGLLYDNTGKAIGKDYNILCDSFCEFAPTDTDADGVSEIVCSQYVSLYSHSDFIGKAKSVLKFDTDTQNFIVINAEFISEN